LAADIVYPLPRLWRYFHKSSYVVAAHAAERDVDSNPITVAPCAKCDGLPRQPRNKFVMLVEYA